MWGELRNVGGDKSGKKKERLVSLFLELVAGPVGKLVIGHEFIALGETPPIPKRVPLKRSDFLFRNRTESAEFPTVVREEFSIA